jgi:hypothetical protein
MVGNAVFVRVTRHAENRDEDDYKQAIYTDAINDPGVRDLAWRLADAARTEGDPTLAAVDRGASKRYLRKCILTRSTMELGEMTVRDFAELWALGILGHARYRVRGAQTGRRR